jgi:uncharacterized membrane protein (DUF4010 family)
VDSNDDITLAIRIIVAALGGLAVGIEREWSRDRKTLRLGGVRTFLLLGLIGGIAAVIQERVSGAASVALLAGAAGLIVASYALKAFRGDVDATTEVSAILVLGAGFLSGAGLLKPASAVFAITALVLVEKSRMHALVGRIQGETLEAGARFAVLALVILPLLPEGPYGPAPGFRPRELWALVLLFSGLSFAGYIALRAVGSDQGYGLAGLLGGLISSTAVTLGFSRDSREQTAMHRAIALGVIAACTILFPRVALLTAGLNPAACLQALPYLAPPFLAGAAAAGLVYRGLHKSAGRKTPALPGNPLNLVAAIQLAIVLQIGLYLVFWVRKAFGSQGLFVSAALVGFTDVDALIYSMTKQAIDAAQVARAIAIGILSNTILKFMVVLVLGRGAFRQLAGTGLAAIAIAIAAALLIF